MVDYSMKLRIFRGISCAYLHNRQEIRESVFV